MESTISFPTDARALAVTARNAFFMDMDPAGTNHDRISAGAGELLLDEPVSAAGNIVALTILVGHHAGDDLVSNQVEVRVYDMVDHDRANLDGADARFTLAASRQCTVGNSNDCQTLPLSAPLPVAAGQYIALFMAAGLESGGGPVAFATLGGTAHAFLFFNADVDQPTRANGTPEQYDWPGWHVEMAVTEQTPPDDGLDQTTHAAEKSWVNIGHWTRASAGRSPAGRSSADTVPVGNLVTHDGAVLFVADGSGIIYRSQDGGQSWDSLSAAPDQVTALALTTDGKTLLAAVRDVTLWFSGSVTGIFQSADNGDSWTPMAAMSPAAWQERLQNQRVLDYVRRGYGQRMLQRFMANDPRLHGQSQALAVTPANNLVLGTADALWKSRTAW
ncbi:MAG: hypothetical protein KDD78_20265, partial [Caldilineaceae bacterium]|nr:hypothetical protein [Caldilineaceae bacterium]